MLDRKDKKEHVEDDFSVSIERTSGAEPVADGVFGAADDSGDQRRGPNYTNVGWIRASVLLMKAQIGLGVLGIPQVFSTVGLVPGIILILVIAAMTTFSSVIIGHWKVNHPATHSIADVGKTMGGVVGREVLGGIYWLYMTCISGSGMLSIAIAFNTFSEHGACTVVFVVVAAILVFLFSSIRTLDRVTILGWIGLVSIVAALLTLAVAVGVQDRPAAAPQPPAVWDKEIRVFATPTFAEAASSLGTIVFAFGGTPGFFNVVAEMRNPRDFTKTVLLTQSFVTLIYIVIGIVVYVFCGDQVASPALGSAGVLMQKVCYGIAFCALLVGSVIYTHLPAKYIFVRILRGSKHLTSNSLVHWATWLSCVGGTTLLAFIIAEAIPVFGGLISLVGALFGTIMSIVVTGIMFFHDHWWRPTENAAGRPKSNGWYRVMLLFSAFMIVGGLTITAAGTYGAVEGIIQLSEDSTLSSFSCADNSGLAGR
ncbi:hypothetical protein OIV83_003958 [Microbotryomycetes sp. JL201]|nr:hypothetical protein OIV83_003958 [Microbotryomycetes sp. JL201]